MKKFYIRSEKGFWGGRGWVDSIDRAVESETDIHMSSLIALVRRFTGYEGEIWVHVEEEEC